MLSLVKDTEILGVSLTLQSRISRLEKQGVGSISGTVVPGMYQLFQPRCCHLTSEYLKKNNTVLRVFATPNIQTVIKN